MGEQGGVVVHFVRQGEETSEVMQKTFDVSMNMGTKDSPRNH